MNVLIEHFKYTDFLLSTYADTLFGTLSFLYLISWTREGWENYAVPVVAAKQAKTADEAARRRVIARGDISAKNGRTVHPVMQRI